MQNSDNCGNKSYRSKAKEIQVSGSMTSPLPSMTGSIDIRKNLSLHLLTSASDLSEKVGCIESENSEKPLGKFFSEILGASSGCVVMAVAAAEAFINETFMDSNNWVEKHVQSTLAMFWEDIEKKSLADKYDLATLLGSNNELE